MELNKKEIHFKPDYCHICDYCGVASFEHIHRVGTLPKDFEMIGGSEDKVMKEKDE